MHSRTRSLLSGALVVLSVLVVTATALAHPPWNPYDDTFFAPITQFGPKIGIKVLVKAENDPITGAPIGNLLTSPLKAIAAPGLPKHVFIVDQPGIIWAVDMGTTPPTRTKFLDVSFNTGTRPEMKVIKLGVCGDDTFDERGLLGLAFHPRYRDNGKFYTYTSELHETGTATIPSPPPGFDPDHQNVIREWQVTNPGNPAAPGISHLRQLMRVDWPQFNHDGGDLAFGPDGMLYISMGDGGAADDADTVLPTFIRAQPKYPQTEDCDVVAPVTGHQGKGNAQKLNTPLGKIHRIDVDGAPTALRTYRVPSDNPFVGKTDPATGQPAVPEIWAFGFRNPYRFSIDNNTLFVGDVGQNDIEEMDSVTVPSRHHRVAGGGNYGWNCKEGTLFFHINGDADGFASREGDASRPECSTPSRTNRGSFIDPIAQYDTHHEGHSVIGGFVCNRCGVSSLRGKLVFGEFARVFKFPRGPHDYGRVLAIKAGGGHGLRPISELLVLPSGDLGLAVLGIGQDADGRIYVMGNVFGVPFGNSGVVVRLVEEPRPGGRDDKDGKDDD